MELIWCSVHEPTKEQIEELQKMGKVMMLKEIEPEMMGKLENTPEDATGARSLAKDFLNYVEGNFVEPGIVQPAGNPMFQYLLGGENSIKSKPIPVFYAYSKRESIEEKLQDGSVVKKSVFKHLGFKRV